MKRSIRNLVVFGLCVFVALLVASSIQGQQSKKDKVQVTGAELQEWKSKFAVNAGMDETNGCVWMVVNFGDGTQELYWYCPNSGNSDIDKGTYRIEGDRICSKWENAPGGREDCWEWYRLGEDKYEYWEVLKDIDTTILRGIFYKLK